MPPLWQMSAQIQQKSIETAGVSAMQLRMQGVIEARLPGAGVIEQGVTRRSRQIGFQADAAASSTGWVVVVIATGG